MSSDESIQSSSSRKVTMPVVGVLGWLSILPVHAKLKGVAFGWITSIGYDIVDHFLTGVDISDGLEGGSRVKRCVKWFQEFDIKFSVRQCGKILQMVSVTIARKNQKGPTPFEKFWSATREASHHIRTFSKVRSSSRLSFHMRFEVLVAILKRIRDDVT